MLYTTLAKIEAHLPCKRGWETLLASLGKTEADNDPLPLLAILESNGLQDALWALRAVDGYDSEKRMLACDFAHRVLPAYEKRYPDDLRPRNTIETARRFARGEATTEELTAALAASWAAARAALAAAWAAAEAAASSAVGAASWAAARAALAAADAAVASNEERAWQEKRFRQWLEETGEASCSNSK